MQQMGSIEAEDLPNIEKIQMARTREEKILVLVRLRPLSEKEIATNEATDWECINDTTILYRNTLREGSTFPSAYTFDRVFRGDCLTRQVYDEGAKEVALSVVSGINSSIFAYGQTSSGKTYTMMGITEYTVADIFDYIQKHEERAFVLKFSAIEIYNEAIRDLLSADGTPLRLLDDQERGTKVEKVTEETLKDWKHLQELLSVCETQRRIGETSLNEKSSRSHQILRLTIESSAREFLGKENSTALSATVNFVDLAGSERASQASLSSEARLKEGCHINRSLLTLGTVIRKLSKGRHGHINYRDSKLTRLLQPALGGNARTAIICTLSPARSHVEQTRNTLLFAACAKEVTTKAQVNVVMSDKALVKHLQRELARLESELRSPAPTSSNGDYAALLRKKDLQIQKMEKEIRELTKQRDLAESRIQDLLQLIGHHQNSKKEVGKSHHHNRQADDVWDFVSESSGLADPYSLDGGAGSTHYETNSGNSIEEPYQDNTEEPSVSDDTSSLMSIRKFGSMEYTNDNCKEVRCIEMEDTRRQNTLEPSSVTDSQDEERLALMVLGDADAAGEELSTPINGERALSHVQNSTYGLLEQRRHHGQKAISDIISLHNDEASPQSSAADMSSSRMAKLTRSWSSRENLVADFESTPPNGLDKQFTGRPEGLPRKFPPLNYDANNGILLRNDSQSSIGSAYTETDDFGMHSNKDSAHEDIPSVQTFVAGLKEMVKQEYEKKHVDGQETGTVADSFGRTLKDAELDPMNAELEYPDWTIKFEKQQKAILELWQTCNVSLVHRTYFFLLFKGDPTDSIYMEVEHRRLSFLKETFSRGNQFAGGNQIQTLTLSIKALHRERLMLSKLMQKRFSDNERKRMYEKWGIALNSKRRRLQLANCLWSNTQDMNHNIESAAIVAKLVRFVEHGQALKGMFGLSFTPPSSSMRRRSLVWSYSKSSVV